MGNQATLRLANLGGGGAPLSVATRRNAEMRFGADFSSVRVHSDTAAATAATEHNARAFTVGDHVVIGADARGDSRTLAHELAHVVQQRRGSSEPAPLLGGALEVSAARSADAFMRGDAHVDVTGASAVGIMRDPAPFLAGPMDALSDRELEQEIRLFRRWLQNNPVSGTGRERALVTLQRLEEVVLRRNAAARPRASPRQTPARLEDGPVSREPEVVAPGPRSISPQRQTDTALDRHAIDQREWLLAHPQTSSGSAESEDIAEHQRSFAASEQELHERSERARQLQAAQRAAQFGGIDNETLLREERALGRLPNPDREMERRRAVIQQELVARVQEEEARERERQARELAAQTAAFDLRRRSEGGWVQLPDPDTGNIIGYFRIGTDPTGDLGTLYVRDPAGHHIYSQPEFVTGPTVPIIDPIDFAPMVLSLGVGLARVAIRVGVNTVTSLATESVVAALRARAQRHIATRVLSWTMNGIREAVPIAGRGAAGSMGSLSNLERGAVVSMLEGGEQIVVASAERSIARQAITSTAQSAERTTVAAVEREAVQSTVRAPTPATSAAQAPLRVRLGPAPPVAQLVTPTATTPAIPAVQAATPTPQLPSTPAPPVQSPAAPQVQAPVRAPPVGNRLVVPRTPAAPLVRGVPTGARIRQLILEGVQALLRRPEVASPVASNPNAGRAQANPIAVDGAQGVLRAIRYNITDAGASMDLGHAPVDATNPGWRYYSMNVVREDLAGVRPARGSTVPVTVSEQLDPLGGTNAIVRGPGTYVAIYNWLDRTMRTLNMTDAQLATEIAGIIQTQTVTPAIPRATVAPLTRIAFLMFSREAIRNPATVAIAPMVLSMIAHGQMTWREALAGSNVRWGGGWFPMAAVGASTASRGVRQQEGGQQTHLESTAAEREVIRSREEAVYELWLAREMREVGMTEFADEGAARSFIDNWILRFYGLRRP